MGYDFYLTHNISFRDTLTILLQLSKLTKVTQKNLQHAELSSITLPNLYHKKQTKIELHRFEFITLQQNLCIFYNMR